MNGEIFNIKDYFQGITFEPILHKYTLNGSELISVSKLLTRYYEPFDSIKASITAAKGDAEYALDLRLAWALLSQGACSHGSSIHELLERLLWGEEIENLDKWHIAINDAVETILGVMNLKLVCTEQVVFTNCYAGTFDLLLWDEERQGYVILDWKTNKSLKKNYKGKRMLSPFKSLLDNPWNHYALQLSLYQIPLEDKGFKIVDRMLVHLKKNGAYSLCFLKDYTKSLRRNLGLSKKNKKDGI